MDKVFERFLIRVGLEYLLSQFKDEIEEVQEAPKVPRVFKKKKAVVKKKIAAKKVAKKMRVAWNKGKKMGKRAWTPERLAKFQETIRRKRKGNLPEESPRSEPDAVAESTVEEDSFVLGGGR